MKEAVNAVGFIVFVGSRVFEEDSPVFFQFSVLEERERRQRKRKEKGTRGSG